MRQQMQTEMSAKHSNDITLVGVLGVARRAVINKFWNVSFP